MKKNYLTSLIAMALTVNICASTIFATEISPTKNIKNEMEMLEQKKELKVLDENKKENKLNNQESNKHVNHDTGERTIDQIFKDAYYDTVEWVNLRMQECIKEASEVIGRIPSDFEYSIGEVLKQFDTIQKSVFEKISGGFEQSKKLDNNVCNNKSSNLTSKQSKDILTLNLDEFQQNKINSLIQAINNNSLKDNYAFFNINNSQIKDIHKGYHKEMVKRYIHNYRKKIDGEEVRELESKNSYSQFVCNELTQEEIRYILKYSNKNEIINYLKNISNNSETELGIVKDGSYNKFDQTLKQKKYNQKQAEAEKQARLKKEQEEKQKQAEAEKQARLKREQEEKQKQAEAEKQARLKREQEEKQKQAEAEKQAQLKKEQEEKQKQAEAERQAQLKKEQERIAKIEEEKLRIKQQNNKLIEDAKNDINLGDLTNVKNNLTLPNESSNGVKIIWKSDDEATIKNDGTVTRPNSDSQDKKVKLVATFIKDEETSTKEFEAIVKVQEKFKEKTRTDEIIDLLKEDKPIEFKKPENFDIAIKEAIRQLKPSFEMIVPYSQYKEYNFNRYSNIMLQLGGEDYGKPGVSTQGGVVIDGKVKMKVIFNYRKNISEVKKQKKATEEAVEKVINEVIKPGMTDIQKEIALHDYVVKHADYNMEGLKKQPYDLEDHSAYGVLVLGKGVCESYAKAMHLLLNKAGIECKYVTGYKRNTDGSQGGGHAWNMVKLDDQWYNLDATWDDPVSDRVGRNSDEDIITPIIHTYFNVTDDVLNKDHIRGDYEEKNYPKCNATKYSYDNMDIDEYTDDGNIVPKVTNKEELDKLILEALKTKKSSLYLRIKGFNMTQQQLSEEIKIVANGRFALGWSTLSSDKNHVLYKFNW